MLSGIDSFSYPIVRGTKETNRGNVSTGRNTRGSDVIDVSEHNSSNCRVPTVAVLLRGDRAIRLKAGRLVLQLRVQ